MTEIIVQYDDIDPSQVPVDAVAIAGYVGGAWPDFSELVRRFPHARHKSIAVNAEEDADILDVETGDAVPDQAPAWLKRQMARGIKPGVYADASTMPSVVAAIERAGIKREEYVMWISHLHPSAPTPPFEQGADAIQWTFTALGRNLDESVCLSSFWGDEKPKPVSNHPHYDWFVAEEFELNGEKVVERDVVEEYDKLRVLVAPTAEEKLRLAVAKVHLKLLADRVLYVSHHPLKNGKPTYGEFHRGWRFQQLIHRAYGWRFV